MSIFFECWELFHTHSQPYLINHSSGVKNEEARFTSFDSEQSLR